VKYLEREMDLLRPLLNPRARSFSSTSARRFADLLSPDDIRRLGEMIHSRFTFAPDAEAGVEVDPRRLTRDHLVALRELGCNAARWGCRTTIPWCRKPCIVFSPSR